MSLWLLGLHLNFGAIYTAKISDFDFNLGYVYDMGSVISAERSNLIEPYRLGTVSELIEDTILYNNIEGDFYIGENGVKQYKKVLANNNYERYKEINKVAIENSFGAGTIGSHFEEGLDNNDNTEFSRMCYLNGVV